MDLTAYVEKHEFCFDAVLDEHVTNDEVLFHQTNGNTNLKDNWFMCLSCDHVKNDLDCLEFLLCKD